MGWEEVKEGWDGEEEVVPNRSHTHLTKQPLQLLEMPSAFHGRYGFHLIVFSIFTETKLFNSGHTPYTTPTNHLSLVSCAASLNAKVSTMHCSSVSIRAFSRALSGK